MVVAVFTIGSWLLLNLAVDAGSPLPAPSGQTNSDSELSESYWTPERLERAVPRELPRAPVPRPHPKDDQAQEESGSVSRGGNAGQPVPPSQSKPNPDE